MYGGFHVMSYQANFASHRTHAAMLISFPQFCIGKHNKISQNFSFHSYHNTKLQKKISTHTRVKFKILL